MKKNCLRELPWSIYEKEGEASMEIWLKGFALQDIWVGNPWFTITEWAIVEVLDFYENSPEWPVVKICNWTTGLWSPNETLTTDAGGALWLFAANRIILTDPASINLIFWTNLSVAS
jgi:hypothetical protein